MKRPTILITVIALLSLLLCQFSANAQEEDEFLRLFGQLIGSDALISAEITGENEDYSTVTYSEKAQDYAFFVYNNGSTEPLDIQSAIGVTSVSVETIYVKKTQLHHLSVTFATEDHEANYQAALAVFQQINDQAQPDRAYVCLDGITSGKTVFIYWSTLYTYDQFGMRSSLGEEMTDAQIRALNSQLAENSLPAVIDTATGKVIYEEQSTPADILRVLVWIKENYGFEPAIMDNAVGHFPNYDIRVLHFSEIPGDVNNDSRLNISDGVILQRFLLGMDIGKIFTGAEPYHCFMPENADLSHDQRIDVFDLILLKQLLVNQ